MSENIKGIQELINERAESKLRSDIKKLHQPLKEQYYKLLDDIKVNVGTSEKPSYCQLSLILGSDGFEKTIIDKNIQKYIEAETKEFLEKVESLRDDVDNLLNNANY